MIRHTLWSRLCTPLLALALGLGATSAWAHKSSDAYLSLVAAGDRLQVRWDIALRDLDRLLDLDQDRDARLTWGEVRTQQPRIVQAALQALELRGDGSRCVPGDVGMALTRHSDGAYAVLSFDMACAAHGQLTIAYSLFERTDPDHRAIVRSGGQSQVVVPDGQPVTLPLLQQAHAQAGAQWRAFISYLAAGFGHILVGADHLVFLCLLMLPAVMRRTAAGWVAQTDLRASLKTVALTATAFTASHTLTLSAAALHWLVLPSRWVEAAIAASIVVCGVAVLRGWRRLGSWPAALGFGLVHGLGFAAALDDAGLHGAALARGLLGFNLGVELGQLVFVLAVWPALWWCRTRRGAGAAMVPVLAVAMALIGGAWLVERVFLVELLPG